MPAVDKYKMLLSHEEVEGIEAPQFQDTPIEGSLEAPMMNEQISMVPPGLESTDRVPKRLVNYQHLSFFYQSPERCRRMR